MQSNFSDLKIPILLIKIPNYSYNNRVRPICGLSSHINCKILYSKLNPLACGIIEPVYQIAKVQADMVMLFPSTIGWANSKSQPFDWISKRL